MCALHGGTTYWFDHVKRTADARVCVTDMAALYGCFWSDHYPLLSSIDFVIVPVYTSENKHDIHLDHLLPCDINNYMEYGN